MREIIDLNKYHYTPTRDLMTNKIKDITHAIDSSHNLDEDIVEGDSGLIDSMNIKTVHEGEIIAAIT